MKIKIYYMKNLRFIIFTFTLFLLSFATAQTRGVADNAIPGDNTMRYYRLALPVTLSAYKQDLGGNYNNVLSFWRECEDFANRMFVPLGICFDVVEDARLVMPSKNLIDENIYNTTSFGTELTDAAIGSANYDVGMWVHHRDEFAENSGLSVGNGVYNSSTKSSGYAKTDKWVVAHELGHMFGADFHTVQGEGSLMDNEGEYFSYPSLLLIREESVKNGVGSANVNKNVTNSAPQFTSAMKDTYRIPQGACVAIPVFATDDEGHLLTYSAIGCSSTNVGNVNGENGVLPDFKSLIPQTSNIIDYSPKYSAYINDASYYYEITGTNIPSMAAGSYSIAFLVNDMPSSTAYDYLLENPFYSNYAVWDAKVQIVSGPAFNASLTPQQNNYSAGEPVTVKWGVNHSYFTTESRVRITMSTNYGESFDYVLAESVPATDGSCVVTLPNVNVGNVDVDFITAVRSMRGGIIRVEEIGGIAYTLTTLTPANGGGFTVTGGGDVPPAVNTYKITVASNVAGGLAFINNNGVTEGNYSEGTKIKLSAVEDVDKSGYLFNGWYKNGKLVSTDEYCEIVVNESAHYEARFEKGCVIQALDRTRICQVTISDTNKKEGTGRLVVRSGEKVTMSVVVDPYYKGYVFLGWCNVDGEVLSKDLNYVVTVTEDVIYYAVAELAHYTLKVSTPDKNMGSVQAISGTFEWAEEVEVGYNTFAMLSAIPNDGYVFVNWTKDGVVVATEQEYRVSEITDLNAMVDVEYVAHFMEETEKRYSVSAEVNPFTAGFVSFSKKDIEYGGSVTLTASVNEGYAFVNWTLDGKVVGSELELTVNNVTKDLRYVANYRVTDPLTGRWFRLKEKNSGLYMDVNHEGEITNAHGKVKISAKNKDSEKQIVLFEKVGDGYKLKSRSGYYIDGEKWNVNTASEENTNYGVNADVFMLEETGTASEYKIKWNNINYDGAPLQYFKVGTANEDDSGIVYVYCDAVESAAATWILEEVADKSKLQELIAEATELFNQVADDKTKIDIKGKITSNAPHNTADGNEAGYKDGDGYAALTDNNPETYFHSRWGGTAVNEAHYLQINLSEGESLSDFIFEYAVRKAGDAGSTSPAPTAMEVRVSTDGQNFGDPIAQYAGGTNANSLPAHGDLGKTLWNSGVISAGEKIRHIRLTVTNSAGPGNNTFGQYKFFAMGTLNLYSPQPSLKEDYKNNPMITEEMLVALSTALADANSVNDDDAATTEEVNEAILTLRAQKEALENALIPVSFTLAQVTASNLMEKTEPTYIAVKNISGTNNLWFVGTGNVEEFSNSTVLVWEPVVEGQKGSYYIRNTYGKYIQNTSPITFGTVEGAAVFTAKNATTKGSGDTKFNGDNGDQNTLANINSADDPNLVRFVTGTQWINVQTAGGNPTYNNGEGGYTVHFVYEATMVNEFTVNVTDAQFATFYAPVNVTLPDNATVYILDGVKKGNWASLAEVEGAVLPKNTAVLLYSETLVECKFTVTDAAADAKVDGNKLLGTVQDAYIKKDTEKSYYILSKKDGIVAMYNPVLGEVEDKFKNRANRAYLVLDKNDIPQQTAGLRFLFPGTTAVEEVTTEHATVESIYDLQGRKLTEITSPGIYIINGKKVFVK